jgi:hypothetical protein
LNAETDDTVKLLNLRLDETLHRQVTVQAKRPGIFCELKIMTRWVSFGGKTGPAVRVRPPASPQRQRSGNGKPPLIRGLSRRQHSHATIWTTRSRFDRGFRH